MAEPDVVLVRRAWIPPAVVVGGGGGLIRSALGSVFPEAVS